MSIITTSEILEQRDQEMKALVPEPIYELVHQFADSLSGLCEARERGRQWIAHSQENRTTDGMFFLGLLPEQLIDDGLLSVREVDGLLEVARDIAGLLYQVSDEDTANSRLGSMLFDHSVNYIDGTSRGYRRFQKADPVVDRFFRLSRAISDRGAFLLPDSDTLQYDLDTALNRQQSLMDAEHAQVTRFDIASAGENPNLLTVLSLVDIHTFVKQLPDKIVLDYAKRGEDVSFMDTRELLFLMLVDSCRQSEDYQYRLQSIFEGQPKTPFSRKLKGSAGVLHEQGSKIFQNLSAIYEYHEASLKVIIGRSQQLSEEAGVLRGAISGAGAQFDDLHKTLMNQIWEYAREGHSREHVMGALAVENWIEAALADSNLLGFWDNPKPLHSVINAKHEELQLQEIHEAIQLSTNEITDIEDRYSLTNAQLRKMFPNGLQLGRRLEEWVEPGSNRNLFLQDQARQIVGLALMIQVATHDEKLQCSSDVKSLRQAWADLALLQGNQVNRTGLVRSLDVLSEWHESAPNKLLNDKQLAPVWDLAKLLNVPPEKQQQTTQPSARPGSLDENESHWHIPVEFAHVEFIEPFPPGNRDDIIRDLTAISQGWHGETVDWERIHSLIDLRQELQAKGLAVATHRLRQTSWHPLPHYVLEVVSPSTGEVAAIVESPIYGNASYVIPDKDWREIVRFSKEEVRRDWGGIAKVHAAHAPASWHRDKLKAAVIANI